MNSADLQQLISLGESESLEFKRTTGELREGLESLCAFLNGSGGRVLFGVNRKGEMEGQQVSEQTIHELSAQLQRFEPPPQVDVARVHVQPDREIVVLEARPDQENAPFTFDTRPFERVGNTTRKMSQARYEQLLLNRSHVRRRWENQPAVDVKLEDLDHEEILHTREEAIRRRHISAGTSLDIGDILDRLGLRRNGVITQAAHVLYGKNFLPDYPQCQVKMARFRGLAVTGDILDNRQEYLNAFAVMRETVAFLDRTLPLSSHFTEGKILRDDRLPVPPNALREILLNAVIHRDYSSYSGYLAVAVFDDRIEIRSTGLLPAGMTIEMLSGPHLSTLRNPLITAVFHRVGAIEAWGRGTNRVIDECRQYGVEPPTFRQEVGMLIVTFKVQTGPGADRRHPVGAQSAPSKDPAGTQSGPSRDQVEKAPSRDPVGTQLGPSWDPVGTKSAPSRHQVGTKSAPSRHQVDLQPVLTREQEIVLEALSEPLTLFDLMERCGRTDRTKFRRIILQPLLDDGLLAMTIPDKPRSSRQRYQTTAAGKKVVGENG